MARLWTIQRNEAFVTLNRDGVLYCDSPRNAIHLDEGTDGMLNRAYVWMIAQMEKRIPSPRPDMASYPLWAWAQVGSYKKEFHPSSNEYEHGRDVLLVLDVPEEEYLLSDFSMWHHVINGWSTGVDPVMERRMRRYMDEHKISDMDNLPDEYRDYVVSSWERIFDLKLQDKNFPSMKRNRDIQATMWQIRSEWVKGYRML